MEFSLFGSGSTKGFILQILSKEWPLSAKKIYFAVKKVSGKSITYQAAYKAIRELLGEGVLSKQGNEYLISPIWVSSSNEFIGKLAETYEKNDLAQPRKIQELNFNSVSEAWDFLISKLNTNFFGNSSDAYIQFRRLFFMPISKENIEVLKEFASKKKVYVMCRENSLIERMAGGFLSSLGAHVMLGVECARPTNCFVYGNSVVHFYILEENERAKIHKYYADTKDMKMVGKRTLGDFGNVFLRKMRVKLIINRDPGVLSDVVEQTKLILSKRPS